MNILNVATSIIEIENSGEIDEFTFKLIQENIDDLHAKNRLSVKSIRLFRRHGKEAEPKYNFTKEIRDLNSKIKARNYILYCLKKIKDELLIKNK